MRWKPLSMRCDPPTVVIWCLAALTAPVWAPLLGLIWLEREKCKLIGPSKDWGPWFAWHPVEVWPRDGEPHSVWLEWIERRAGTMSSATDYRSRL
jgi:hypothetical protein